MHQDNTIDIKSLDMDARGIGHLQNDDGSQGKVIFVEGALPGENVSFHSFRKKKKWEFATMTDLHRESVSRIKPRCQFYGVCGGCAMQHLEPNAQVAVKQRVLEDNLWHISKIKADLVLRPIYGPTWEYRYRARISVRNVPKKGGVLVGFHERKSPYVTDMTSCDILPAKVSAMLVPLRGLIGSLTIIEHLPQIELAVGESAQGQVTVMVLRIMAALSAEDEVKLKAFADAYEVQWWLQTGPPETAIPYYPAQSELYYTLPEFNVRMPFKPTDFTQVNHQINRVLVAKALRLLGVQSEDRVADLFCGLGNFTLPLATLAREVVGIEGSDALVVRSRENAVINQLEGKTTFYSRNLFEVTTADFIALGQFNRMLIDPPRDGAATVCAALVGLSDIGRRDLMPTRIVYVSCSPSTLARDAGTLAQGGYRLSQAGVVNMFPHTAHVESIAVFDLVQPQ
ncbi:23S rRNA (uracil(1939)-C(5))-methyltransferase RlmD [Glaciimonas immobilis]|uniref:23S rRNA (uracil(1939)-C(5))-methyltransferase RlmD n=1 Tax=Glaciimonas immobilis TaxID=728004 RepID=A0A840RMC9_9BURK|nr:23S rRNA (uracil(1939)-C(5))-methyltransferase RlmD [Glaciimonas immobilis]KAF3998849.1 23S rRNA (uracil(1939)-C(5))-methyltransferase RlmD [Glaciimonas immobilis]MBB5198242.1 23S rRNA (uracil1939-C5)-methyltransferase [Glaciimonas immobilis]